MTHKKTAPPPPLVFDDLDDLEAFMSAVQNNADNPEPALEVARSRALAALRAGGVDFELEARRSRALAKLRARGDDIIPDAPSLLAILSAIRNEVRAMRLGEVFPTLRLDTAQGALVDFAIRCCQAGPMTSDDIFQLRVAAMAAYGWRAHIDVTHREATRKQRVVASRKGGEKTKKKAARRHKPIVAALADGQSVKAVQLERELAGKKKAPSERTIRRVKKAKGI